MPQRAVAIPATFSIHTHSHTLLFHCGNVCMCTGILGFPCSQMLTLTLNFGLRDEAFPALLVLIIFTVQLLSSFTHFIVLCGGFTRYLFVYSNSASIFILLVVIWSKFDLLERSHWWFISFGMKWVTHFWLPLNHILSLFSPERPRQWAQMGFNFVSLDFLFWSGVWWIHWLIKFGLYFIMAFFQKIKPRLVILGVYCEFNPYNMSKRLHFGIGV